MRQGVGSSTTRCVTLRIPYLDGIIDRRTEPTLVKYHVINTLETSGCIFGQIHVWIFSIKSD